MDEDLRMLLDEYLSTENLGALAQLLNALYEAAAVRGVATDELDDLRMRLSPKVPSQSVDEQTDLTQEIEVHVKPRSTLVCMKCKSKDITLGSLTTHRCNSCGYQGLMLALD